MKTKYPLTDEQVAAIRHELNVVKRTPTDVAKQFGLPRQLISGIAWGKYRVKKPIVGFQRSLIQPRNIIPYK